MVGPTIVMYCSRFATRENKYCPVLSAVGGGREVTTLVFIYHKLDDRNT